MRRFTRLTNGFSKKLANHQAAIALWVCFYNLCRVHESLRMTPAMALGVTDHIWTIGELIHAVQEPQEAPPLPPIAPTDTLGGRTPFKPYVIAGGRAATKPKKGWLRLNVWGGAINWRNQKALTERGFQIKVRTSR
jgi:hypothetical protein